MKRIISLLLLITMSPLSALANVEIANVNNDTLTQNKEKISLYKKPMPIEDELVKSDSFPKIFTVYVKDNEPITDELMNNHLVLQ